MAGEFLVFAKGREQRRVEAMVGRVVHRYATFLLVEATDEQVQALRAQGFVVEPRAPQAKPEAPLEDVSPPVPEGRHHFIVTFIGPVQSQWLEALQARGGILREPMPPYSYVVELDTSTLPEIQDLPFVSSVEWYDPGRRIDEGVLDTLKGRRRALTRQPRVPSTPPMEVPEDVDAETGEGEARPRIPSMPRFDAEIQVGVVRVVFFTREQRDAGVNALEDQGIRVRSLADESETDLLVFLPEDEDEARRVLLTISRIHGVQTIVPVILPGLSNDVAARILEVTPVRDTGESRRFTGKGEIVGVVDTGLDTGDPADLHPDFQGRIVGIVSWPVSLGFAVENVGHDDGPADTVSGHGTHVSGSIVGTGAASIARGLPPIRGMAPDARLFFQAVQQHTEFSDGSRGPELTGFPADIRKLLRQAYDAGARVYNISIAFSSEGRYDLVAWQIDHFVWEHPDMVIVVGAGNESQDQDRDGRVEVGTVTSPATAKNVISVGASESTRHNIGLNMTWGQAWPGSFPAPPLRDDLVADNVDHIAAFSGRGPTRDGRIKPDVIAPGTNIVSTRSRVLPPSTFGWGPHPLLPDLYMANGGTSMASPLVAGCATLLREYLRKVKRRRPSAALIKALLIHSAKYVYYDLDPGEGPYDFAQGWGRVRLGYIIHPPSPLKVYMYERRRGLMTGEHITRWVDVLDSSEPLAVTLVWTDAPGSPRQLAQLVNDLDLVVIAPDGRRYHGNQFTPPHDQAFDRTNNVERVIIPHPMPGRYLIRVYATNVLVGPQGFALVWSAIGK